MANPEETATLPRPESESSPQPPTNDSAPPVVDTTFSQTPEGHQLPATDQTTLSSVDTSSALPPLSDSVPSTAPHPTKPPNSDSSATTTTTLIPTNGSSELGSTTSSSSGVTGSTNTSASLAAAPRGPSTLMVPETTSSTQRSITPTSTTTSESTPAHHTPITHAPPKKFTSVSLNRMFREKSGTGSVSPAPAPIGPKTSTPSTQVQQPPPLPHSGSRLVMKKLATPSSTHASSSSPSQVWRSSPNSSNPSSAATTPALQHTPSASSPFGHPAGGGGALGLSTSGKPVSQAGSPWSASAAKAAARGGSGLAAGPNSNSNSNGGASMDFPTAAEAANSKKVQAEAAAARQVEQDAVRVQQAEAADRFRGMHLDPNAHHWDEDGDDDDFLNEVIEFGDGTQYTVKHEEHAAESESLDPAPEEEPVRKEDRFGKDMGRSWPAPPPAARAPEQQRPDKALFNERSNRFEHANSYSQHPPAGPFPLHANGTSNGNGNDHHPTQSYQPSSSSGPGQGSAWNTRRQSQGEQQYQHQAPPGGRWQHRDRDQQQVPPPQHDRERGPSTLLMTRKQSSSTTGGDGASSALSPNLRGGHTLPGPGPRPGSRASASGPISPNDATGFHGSGRQNRSRGPSFVDQAPDVRWSRSESRNSYTHGSHPAPARDPSRESAREREPFSPHQHQYPHGPPPHLMQRGDSMSGRDRSSFPIRRQSSSSHDMPPPPVPPHRLSGPGGPGSVGSNSNAMTRSPASSTAPLQRSPALSTASPRPLPAHLSPAHVHATAAPPPPMLKVPTVMDVQEFSKDTMHTAAERARERRRKEEEEREKERERARIKANELAEAAEAAKRAKAAEEEEQEKRTKAQAEAEVAAEALIKEEADALARKESEAAVAALTSPAVPSGPPVWRVRSSRGSKRGAPTPGGNDAKPASTTPGLNAPSIPGEADSANNQASLPSSVASAARPRPSSWANAVKDPEDVEVPPTPDSARRPPVATVGGASWRSKAPPPSAPLPSLPSASTLATPSLPTVFDVNSEEHDALELFDFNDMHKLVGGEEPASAPAPDVPSTPMRIGMMRILDGPPTSLEQLKASRPIEVLTSSSASRATNQPSVDEHPHSHPLLNRTSSSNREGNHDSLHPGSPLRSTLALASSSPVLIAKALSSPQFSSNLPLPTTGSNKVHYRESSMTSLEDAMSRIRGALSGMHPGAGPSTIGDVLTAGGAIHKSAATLDDSFALTQLPRPSTPPPAGKRYLVRIRKEWPPKVKVPVPRRTLLMANLPPQPMRWDILSWDPPVQGMSRKTLSRDEVLMPLESSPSRPIVGLPKSSTSAGTTSAASLAFPSSAAVPKVNIPASSTSSHRAVRRNGIEAASLLEVMESVSRSPPPTSPARRASLSLPPSTTESAVPSTNGTSSPVPDPSSLASSVNGGSRPKSSVSRHPIGPDGVSFSRRVARTHNDSITSIVSFTVSSELESEQRESEVPKTAVPNDMTDIPASSEISGEPASVSRSVTPPPKSSTPWAKSPLVYQPVDASSSRNVAADPENIKSLWDTNDKDVVTLENSLEGISDELPTFSVPDMKSDDGDDPKSPKPAAPLVAPAPPLRKPRMSARDVTRAFQQVPTSPAGAPDLSSATYGPIMQPSTSTSTSEEQRPTTTNPPAQPAYSARPPRPTLPLYSSGSTPVIYPMVPYMMPPNGQPGQRFTPQPGRQPSTGHPQPMQSPGPHVWMPVTPVAGSPGPPYYRPTYGQPVVYSPSTFGPSGYAPLPVVGGTPLATSVSLPQMGKPNGNGPARTPPTRSLSGSGHNTAATTPQHMSPAPGHPPLLPPSYMPMGAQGRMAPPAGYYTPSMQQAPLPMAYPSSPAPMYSAVSTHSSGSNGPPSAAPLYSSTSSTPHTAYRPHPHPPSW